MRKWQVSPPERRFTARKVDGATCPFTELRKGDLFQVLAPDGKTVLHPHSSEEDADAWALALGDPNPDYIIRNEGFCIEVDVGALDALKAKGTN